MDGLVKKLKKQHKKTLNKETGIFKEKKVARVQWALRSQSCGENKQCKDLYNSMLNSKENDLEGFNFFF